MVGEYELWSKTGETKLEILERASTVLKLKVPIAANLKDVCLQNTSKSHSYHLKIWDYYDFMDR